MASKANRLEVLMQRYRLLDGHPTLEVHSRVGDVRGLYGTFLANQATFSRHLSEFRVSTTPFGIDQDDLLARILDETFNLLHNYLAACYSLRKCTDSLVGYCSRSHGWSLVGYNSKVEDLDGDGLYAFMTSLRGHCQHFRSPPLKARFWAVGDEPTRRSLVLAISDLRGASARWPQPARAYVENQPDTYLLEEMVRSYYVLVKGFYRWFWEWLKPLLEPQIGAYEAECKKLAEDFAAAGFPDPFVD